MKDRGKTGSGTWELRNDMVVSAWVVIIIIFFASSMTNLELKKPTTQKHQEKPQQIPSLSSQRTRKTVFLSRRKTFR